MRVLHVLQYSLPTLFGYTIRASGILRSQSEMGWDVHVLTGGLQPAAGGAEVERVDGVPYYRTPALSGGAPPLWREWKLYRALGRRLKALLPEVRPDLVHVHSPVYNGWAALRAARRYGLPCVYEVRAIWEDAAVDGGKFGAGSPLYKIARHMETRLVHNANAVVTICDGLRREMISRKAPEERLFVVPNAVQADAFPPRPRNEELARSLGLNGGTVFGFIGSLFAYEGVEDLLEAAPAILGRCPGARILVVGGGERQEQVQALAAACGKSVVYRPRVPHSEVQDYYSLVDCLVYPRRSVRLTELVTPLKPLEAMAMRKCVIASDIGGHREMIEHERTGILYPAGDRQGLIDAAARAASDSDWRQELASAGREYVLSERNWRRVAEVYTAVYEAARAHHAGRTRSGRDAR